MAAIWRLFGSTTLLVAASLCLFSANLALADDDDNDMSESVHLPRPQGMQQEQRQDSQQDNQPVRQEQPRDPSLTLNRQQAREYMVVLINKDRAAEQLQPVVLDMVASEAGQSHTDEMVAHGYHGHWGMDGKKPPQRYTEGGGRDYVAENAWFSGFTEGTKGKPDADPFFSREELERAESVFMAEKPPMDGHRKNILNPSHDGVGVCLSRATGNGDTFRMAMTQEFVDHYGAYQEIPHELTIGDQVTVAGQLYPNFHLHDITVYREDLPKPMSIAQLNATYSYNFPDRVVVYFPPPFHSDIPISVTTTQQGEQFSAEIPIEKKLGGEGLYSIGIWAVPLATGKPIMVSLRTIAVTKRAHDKSKSAR